jgi:hypothetical protein
VLECLKSAAACTGMMRGLFVLLVILAIPPAMGNPERGFPEEAPDQEPETPPSEALALVDGAASDLNEAVPESVCGLPCVTEFCEKIPPEVCILITSCASQNPCIVGIRDASGDGVPHCGGSLLSLSAFTCQIPLRIEWAGQLKWRGKELYFR